MGIVGEPEIGNLSGRIDGRADRAGIEAHELLENGMCLVPGQAFGPAIDILEWLVDIRVDRELKARDQAIVILAAGRRADVRRDRDQRDRRQIERAAGA